MRNPACSTPVANNPFPGDQQDPPAMALPLVNTKTGIPGTFLSYSTFALGAEAEDGNGADSPYTTAAAHGRPRRAGAVPIEEAFKRVRVGRQQGDRGPPRRRGTVRP